MISTVNGAMQKLVLKKVSNVFASTTLAHYYSSSLLRSHKIIRLETKKMDYYNAHMWDL